MTEPAVPHLKHLGEKEQVTLTCQDTCHVHHPHFKSFVHQFQRDSQQQLYQQVSHDVLHTREADVGE